MKYIKMARGVEKVIQELEKQPYVISCTPLGQYSRTTRGSPEKPHLRFVHSQNNVLFYKIHMGEVSQKVRIIAQDKEKVERYIAEHYC